MTVTIGQLTNVPNPGAPITSPWAQDVTRLGVHVFASKAALDAQWGTAPDGAHAYTTDTATDWTRVAGAWVARGARGILDYKEYTTNSGPISADVALGPILTVNLPGRRWVELAFWCRSMSSPGGVAFYAEPKFKEGATILVSGLGIGAGAGTAAPGFCSSVHVARTVNAAAGIHTYEIWANASVAGTTIQGTATQPWFIRATDLGPAP